MFTTITRLKKDIPSQHQHYVRNLESDMKRRAKEKGRKYSDDAMLSIADIHCELGGAASNWILTYHKDKLDLLSPTYHYGLDRYAAFIARFSGSPSTKGKKLAKDLAGAVPVRASLVRDIVACFSWETLRDAFDDVLHAPAPVPVKVEEPTMTKQQAAEPAPGVEAATNDTDLSPGTGIIEDDESEATERETGSGSITGTGTIIDLTTAQVGLLRQFADYALGLKQGKPALFFANNVKTQSAVDVEAVKAWIANPFGV